MRERIQKVAPEMPKIVQNMVRLEAGTYPSDHQRQVFPAKRTTTNMYDDATLRGVLK